MGRKQQGDVRNHSTEREWLLQMGGGNIVDGVQQLVQQAAREGKLAYGAPGDKAQKGRK